jgi:hypothetical protein
MSLEFNKVVDQVRKMGYHLSQRNMTLGEKLKLALEWYYNADDLDAVRDRIDLVRKSNVSGYRGATGLDEIVCKVTPTPELPPSATLIAVDGSQIYPDPHASSLYYLINIGAFTTHYGETRLPEPDSLPDLVYTQDLLHDSDGRLISSLTVNARRSVREMQTLARRAWDLRSEARPLIGLYDGGLLKFFGSSEMTDPNEIEQDYMSALVHLHDAVALLAGYLDKPRSTYIISLLHLLSLDDEDVTDSNMKTNGELEGLNDIFLMEKVLMPGERSAILVQNSPQNREYKDRGVNYEIAFFYLNVSTDAHPAIARIDIPMWVARDEGAIDDLHAVIMHQCSIQGRKHYPYALTRADELAYVSSIEKAQLDEMINIEMLKNRMRPEESSKLQSKDLARGANRQHHRIGG